MCNHENKVKTKSGEIVCTSCGLVLDDEKEMVRCRDYYERNSTVRKVESLGSNIGKDKNIRPRFIRLKRIHNNLSKVGYLREKRYIIFIYKLQEHLQLSSKVINSVIYYTKSEINNKEIKNFYHYILVLSYFFSKYYNVPKTIHEIKNIAQKLHHERGFRDGSIIQYETILKKKYPRLFTSNNRDSLLLKLINTIIAAKEVSNKVKDKEKYSINLYKKTKEILNQRNIKIKGKNPVCFFSTIIYIAERFLAKENKRKRYITQTTIQEKVGTSSLTLRSHLREFNKNKINSSKQKNIKK